MSNLLYLPIHCFITLKSSQYRQLEESWKPLPDVITLHGSRALLRIESHASHAPHPPHTTHAAEERLKQIKWIRLQN
jgi:hypothetical protein